MNVIMILCDTLRRDHCGGYHHGAPLNEVWSEQQPAWSVPTPNMDRLAEMGTVFDQAYCGSMPSMPARRDVFTGRYEFPFRGWGPLKEGDRDLPREVSGPPNRSVQQVVQEGRPVSYFVTDHFHLWEQGSGNYHMGFTGFEFIRGIESDAYHTDPIEFPCPEQDRLNKQERHWRNVHLDRKGEEDWFCARTFGAAADWLERNHEHPQWFLMIDSFTPHEPFDAPEEYIKMFDPKGKSVEGIKASAPYAPWADHITEEQLVNYQARYAARVAFLDKWIGQLFDRLDELDLWDDTMVILTTDHGTNNGDRGRTGKLSPHAFRPESYIPFVVWHPEHGHGERRSQLVQLVDCYPTILEALGRPVPPDRHGVSLLPVVADADAPTREFAICGMFGRSISITDGRWMLHQAAGADNAPLNWYGYHLARFLHYPLGEYRDGRRPVEGYGPATTETWLSDLAEDPVERQNVAADHPEELRRMQDALRGTLRRIDAPPEQLYRLGLA